MKTLHVYISDHDDLEHLFSADNESNNHTLFALEVYDDIFTVSDDDIRAHLENTISGRTGKGPGARAPREFLKIFSNCVYFSFKFL